MSMGLAQRLREGTQTLHAAAERAGIMPALLRGSLPSPVFWQLQRNLLLIYQQLEQGLRQHADDPLLAPLELPALARSASLQEDLDALAGPDWPQELALVPAARAYAERLQTLSARQPPALAAHAYVRYLGDLAGGQTLSRVVRRAYGLQGSRGTRFFDFGPPELVAQRARQLRLALDGLAQDAAGQSALVDEARWAFEQHVRLFEELASARV